MFSIFREWYLLYSLRRSHLRERLKLDAAGLLGKGETCTDLRIFLNKIATNRFIWFPRSECAQAKRRSKDVKIIEKSINRTPPFLKKTDTLGVFEHAFSLRAFRSALTPEQLALDIHSISDEVWAQTVNDKDDVFVMLTGDGDQFTLPVACAEFVSKYKEFFVSLVAILIFLSGFTPLYKPFFILVTCRISNVLTWCHV